MPEELDPRFDPQFQRGYDPAKHPAPRSAPKPPIPRVEERAEGARLETAPEQPDARESVSEELDPPRRNPVLLALPILAALLLVAFVGLTIAFIQVYEHQFGQAIVAEDGALLIIGPAFMPSLLVAALLCVTAWLGLRATRALRQEHTDA